MKIPSRLLNSLICAAPPHDPGVLHTTGHTFAHPIVDPLVV